MSKWWRIAFACTIVVFAAVVTARAQRSIRPTGYNIQYSSDRSHMLDVYLPEEGTPPYPVVLMFHGAPGNKGDMASLGIPQIVVGQGYAAVSVTYTTSLPDAYQDAFCALGWIYANAEEQGFDPERVALFGVSAGGLTVAGVAAIDDPAAYLVDCPHTLPEDYALRGVIADAGVFFPSVDEIIAAPSIAPGLPDISAETWAQVTDTLRDTPSDQWRDLDLPGAIRSYLENFPLYWANGNEPPHLLIHGIGDTVVSYEQSLDYARALLEQRVNVELVFDRLSGHVAPPRVFDTEMATFLNRIFD